MLGATIEQCWAETKPILTTVGFRRQNYCVVFEGTEHHTAILHLLFYLTLYWILAELYLLNCCVLAKKKTIIVVHFFSEFASKMESRTTIPQRRVQAVRTSSNESQENDGSVSDSAVTTNVTEGRKRRPSIGHKMAALVGLNRRSSSATQLAG